MRPGEILRNSETFFQGAVGSRTSHGSRGETHGVSTWGVLTAAALSPKGNCPSYELEYPELDAVANGHLVVEHGLDNTAVLTLANCQYLPHPFLKSLDMGLTIQLWPTEMAAHTLAPGDRLDFYMSPESLDGLKEDVAELSTDRYWIRVAGNGGLFHRIEGGEIGAFIDDLDAESLSTGS